MHCGLWRLTPHLLMASCSFVGRFSAHERALISLVHPQRWHLWEFQLIGCSLVVHFMFPRVMNASKILLTFVFLVLLRFNWAIWFSFLGHVPV